MKKNQLKQNLIYNICYQILTLIVPLLTAPYISRILGVAGVGEYGYTYSIANYFVLLIMLGVLNYGNREIAAVKDSKYELVSTFWNIYSVQFFMGVLVSVVYFMYIAFFCYQYRNVAFFQGLYVISGILDISWFYFGIEKFKLTTGISTLNKVLTTILIFLLVKNSSDVYIYVCIIAGGTLLNNVAYWVFLKKNIQFEKPSFIKVKKHIKPLLILFIPVIAVSIYKYMDKIMLGMLLNTSEVGIYESAEKFINLPMCLIAAVGTVMLPRITNMKAHNESKGIRQYNFISMELVMFLSLGMAFGLAGISKRFIPWFYGNGFEKSADVLLILLPSIVFVSWANVIRTQCLLPNKRDKGYCISVIMGAIINLVFNIILIPKLGASGAAIGTLVAEATVSVVQSIMCFRKMDFKMYLKYGIPFFVSAVVMYCCIVHIDFSIDVLTILIRILVGGALYLILASVFMKKIFKKYHNWE